MEQMKIIPQLGFSEAINASTSKIFQFTGRSRRSEFWWTMLLVCIISILLTPLVGFFVDLATIPLTFRRLHDIGKSGWWYGCYITLKVTFLASVIIDVIMSMINADYLVDYQDQLSYTMLLKYGIWLGIIIIYQIILLILFCIDSEIEENKYGNSPNLYYS